MEKFSAQQRMFIAIVLSFVFFIAYDKLYLSKFRNLDVNSSVQNGQMSNAKNPSAPTLNSTPNQITKVANAPINKIDESRVLVKIKGLNFTALIDDFGQIISYKLANYQDQNGENVDLIDQKSDLKPLQIRFADSNLNSLAFNTKYSASAQNIEITGDSAEVTLTQNLGDLSVEKRIIFYQNGKYEMSVNLSKSVEYFLTPGARPDVAVDAYTVHGALLQKNKENKTTLEVIDDGDLNEKDFDQISIASAFDRYYANFLYDFDKQMDVILSEDKEKNIQIFVKASGNSKITGYMGAKNYDNLKAVDERLIDVIEYGWFSFIAKPMFWALYHLHGWVGNWGWAIVIITLLIRILLAPLTYKGMVSMNKLKDIAPKMKELQEKYKDNPEKLRINMMELYKKSGANPMGGCLPILIQIPIFFSIYRVLLNSIELNKAEWAMWIHDLAQKDPYYILPIAMSVLMFIQQRITPTNFTDPMQEKIMKFLPVIFFFIFMSFPAGLTLYWSVNNFASVVQQYFVNKIFARQKAEEIAEKRAENGKKTENKKSAK